MDGSPPESFVRARCEVRSLYAPRVADPSWDTSHTAYADAAAWFVRTTTSVDGRWDRPALGVWTVRDLVGHTSRALLTVESYLGVPADSVRLSSPAAYVTAALASIGDPDAVAQRGRDAGAALGEAVPQAVAGIAERVLARVAVAGPEDVVGTPVGGMRLVDYLPTRTFELTVHTSDLCAALGLAPDVPASAGEASLRLLADLAVTTGRAGPLLRAATGRGGLPPGFSVL